MMRVYRGTPVSSATSPSAVAIGNFDGVHLGHQALLTRLREQSLSEGLTPSVLTFEPHPREFFAVQRGQVALAPLRISTLRDKLEGLQAMGIERTVVEHFNARFAGLSADAFARDILAGGCRARWVLVGKDFRFGAGRQGDVATLCALGRQHGFEVVTLPDVAPDGRRISSSMVREALAQGDLDTAARLLGRPFAISGHVLHGRKLGRTLGFPTANLMVPHRPAAAGIFAVQVRGLADEPLAGVASVGTRPTVDTSGKVWLEVFILDFSASIYGKLIRVEFLKKLRDEKRYDTLDDLQVAIAQDVADARAVFSNLKPQQSLQAQ